MNVADTLAPLLRLLDPEETTNYACVTPTSLDFLGNYRGGIQQLLYTVCFIGAAGTTIKVRRRQLSMIYLLRVRLIMLRQPRQM